MGQVACKRKIFEKITIESNLRKALGFVVLNRDRVVEKLKKNEGELKTALEENSLNANMFKSRANSNTRLINYANAANEIIIVYKTLLNNSIALEMGQEKPAVAQELENYLRTACWATYKLNIEAMQDINHMIAQVLGKKFVEQAMRGHKVSIKLQNYFKSLIASSDEIYEYMQDFLSRQDFSKEEQGKFFLNNYLDEYLKKLGISLLDLKHQYGEPSDQKNNFRGNIIIKNKRWAGSFSRWECI